MKLENKNRGKLLFYSNFMFQKIIDNMPMAIGLSEDDKMVTMTLKGFKAREESFNFKGEKPASGKPDFAQ